MDVKEEIAKHVDKLPPEQQKRVLQFIASLSAPALVGEDGASLRRFASTIDSVSAQQMIQAIEEECEHVDASEW